MLRLAVPVAIGACLLVAEAARAGTMTVHSCQTPSGRFVGTAGWTASGTVGGQPAAPLGVDACASGGGLGVSLPAMPSSVYPLQAWSFVAAPDTAIVGFSASVCGRSYGTRAFAEVARAGGPVAYASSLWPEWPATLGCDGGAVTASGFATASVHLRAWCDDGASCPQSGTSASIELTRFRAEIRDDAAPVVSGAQPLAPERVSFDVTDVGVGVYRAVAEARVGRAGAWRELAVADLGCSPVGERYEFATPQPCPLRVSGASIGFDPAALPTGTHDVRFVVEDAAGNRTDVLPERPYVVAAPAPTSQLRVRVAKTRLIGRLLDLASRPIGGGELVVEARGYLPKARVATGPWNAIGTVATRADGSFTFSIPRGPSRVLRVRHPDGASSSLETLVVASARVTARASRARIRNGNSAVIRGRVAGPIPAGGVRVGLEVRSRGRWIPVATTRRWVRTRPNGAYTLSYRFRNTFSPTTYRFRVVADEDSAFQFTRGSSRSVSVRVRP